MIMRRTLLTLSLAAALAAGNFCFAAGQEEPKPKKDSVNMDTIAKPTFYYAIEDEKKAPAEGKKGAASNVVLVAAAVVIVAGIVIAFVRKKK